MSTNKRPHILIKTQYPPMPEKPSPSKREIESEEFNAIWEVIKTWDIKIPEYDRGYMSANGSHVKLILDALYPVMRNKKIDEVLKKK